MISYVQLYERDIYFVMLALFFLQQKQISEADNEKFIDLVNKGQVITATFADKQDESVKLISSQLNQIFNITDNRIIRNNLAHINYLRPAPGDSPISLDLTDTINQVRTLMAYDRKLKNAVAKSAIDLLARHNFIIEFKMNSQHQLELSSIEPKTIYHLGTSEKTPHNKQVTEALHSEGFAKLMENCFRPI